MPKYTAIICAYVCVCEVSSFNYGYDMPRIGSHGVEQNLVTVERIFQNHKKKHKEEQTGGKNIHKLARCLLSMRLT